MPQYSRRKRRRKNFKFFAFSAVIVGAVLFFAYQQNQLSGESLSSSHIPQTVATTSQPWAETDYSQRRKFNLGGGGIVKYNFDHQEMVDLNKSQADGSDIKIVAQSGAETDNIPYILSGVNTTAATIVFDTSKYPAADYYMYFASRQQHLQPVTDATLSSQNATTITAGDDDAPVINLSPTKYWVLRYKSGAELEASLSIDRSYWQAGDQLYYVQVGSQTLNPITIDNQWTNPVKLNLGQIATGSQGIYLVVQHDGQFYRGSNVYAMVSEPMFVAWTIDWDDRITDASLDVFLSQINNIANQFKIPLTQFFNPQIYIDTRLSDLRRGQLTTWVKQRLLLGGDELALHLHMYTDIVQAAGVTPHNDKFWGSGVDGYDTPTTNYNTEEMTKILQWSVDQLTSRNLPKPAGYRAGGWFANLDTLQALENVGLTYDSSGRESYSYPPPYFYDSADNKLDQSENGKLVGPWHLDHTTQPYQPSQADQNSAFPAPNFNVWEMPDNGNDSYWYSSADLINRFYDNYTSDAALDQPRIVTYISHPDWFYQDQPKLTKLFLETDKYSYAKDQGPVVYTTLSNALKQWQ